jgi:hypothetical protein
MTRCSLAGWFGTDVTRRQPVHLKKCTEKQAFAGGEVSCVVPLCSTYRLAAEYGSKLATCRHLPHTLLLALSSAGQQPAAAGCVRLPLTVLVLSLGSAFLQPWYALWASLTHLQLSLYPALVLAVVQLYHQHCRKGFPMHTCWRWSALKASGSHKQHLGTIHLMRLCTRKPWKR